MNTQNVATLSIDSIFIEIFCQNIKSFSKQNSLLRIHFKPTELTQNWTEIDKNFQCAMCTREMTKTAWPKISFKKLHTLLQPARSRIYLKLKIQVKMELGFSGAEGQDEQLMDCTTITTAFYFMSPPRAFLKLQPLRPIHTIC